MELPEQLNVTDHFLDARVREGGGDRVALVVDRLDTDGNGEATRVTYGQLARHADRFARLFLDLGVEPEQRVLLAARDGQDYVGALFGALKIGAAVVMVNPDVNADEAAYFCRYTRAKVVVACAEAAPRFAAVTDAPLLRRVVVVGDGAADAVDGAQGGRVPLVSFENAAPTSPAPVDAFPTHKDDPAIWLFSGGTTGRPKAVLQTHGAFVNTTVLYGQRVLGIGPDDITLSVPKLYFGYATGSNLLFPLSVGATSVLFPERVTAERLFDLIGRHRPTVLINVPTMVGKMLAADGADDADLTSLRLATSAGEALPDQLFRRFKDKWGVELLDGLGTAEMWHVFLSNRPGDVRPGTLGTVVPGFEVKVCDDDGATVADGETGWLWVRGKSRALGYFQQHDKSCHAFRGEWYVSGDMVRRDADGVFTYCGRGDDMLKVGGKWLAPKEVEGCLVRHAAVEECAVVGVTDASGLVKPYAFVRSREGGDDLAEALKRWVREQLEPYKAPRVVVFLDQFPRTHLGKIDRGQLRRDASSAADGDSTGGAS